MVLPGKRTTVVLELQVVQMNIKLEEVAMSEESERDEAMN